MIGKLICWITGKHKRGVRVAKTMKYLLWLVCIGRGHSWLYQTSGDIYGTQCGRYRCKRCGMHRFVRLYK